MKHSWHKPALWVGAALFLLSPLTPQPEAHAGGPFIPATEVTQILNKIALYEQLTKQALQVTMQGQQLEEQLRNGRSLPSQTFSPVQANLTQLAGVVTGGQQLAYTMGNLDDAFRKKFPGYTATAPAYGSQYATWSQGALDATLSVLKAAGMQHNQTMSAQTVLAVLRGQSTSANGQMNALQIGNEIATQQITELQTLRELMAADIGSKANYQAAQVQLQATQQQQLDNFFAPVTFVGDGLYFK